MLRMEIALILVLGFVAYIYYSAERDADGACTAHFRRCWRRSRYCSVGRTGF